MAYTAPTAAMAKITIPGKPGPVRKHYCPAHDTVMTPIKQYGRKSIMFECKEGCRLGKNHTNLR